MSFAVQHMKNSLMAQAILLIDFQSDGPVGLKPQLFRVGRHRPGVIMGVPDRQAHLLHSRGRKKIDLIAIMLIEPVAVEPMPAGRQCYARQRPQLLPAIAAANIEVANAIDWRGQEFVGLALKLLQGGQRCLEGGGEIALEDFIAELEGERIVFDAGFQQIII